MQITEIQSMTRKQQKEYGISINKSKRRVCDKQLEGCSIYIEIGDLFHPEHGVGGWNFIIRKTCLSCYLKELEN